MKSLFTILTLIITVVFCFGQSPREKSFVFTLEKVVVALAKRDSVALSKYIDKKTGVYILDRIGTVDNYRHYLSAGFSDTSYPNAPFYDRVRLTPLIYSTLPTYDCEKWTMNGAFVDTAQTDHLLSTIAKSLNKTSKNKIEVATINDFYALENKSRRIVITGDEGNELIIYLSYINHKWVLSIIDKVTCDCSV